MRGSLLGQIININAKLVSSFFKQNPSQKQILFIYNLSAYEKSPLIILIKQSIKFEKFSDEYKTILNKALASALVSLISFHNIELNCSKI